MIFPASKENIAHAASLLEAGELVAFPTETVYGLGANAFDEKAVEKIFLAKGRPSFNPLIVHISNITQARELVLFSDQKQEEMFLKLSKFWPGPLSIILPKNKAKIPDIISAGKESVALRIPAHKVALELLSQVSFPLAAPSANPSNFLSPTRAEHVQEYLGEKVSLVLNGGPCEIGLESTVVSLLEETACILRPGKISKEQLEEMLEETVVLNAATVGFETEVLSPGQLALHYAPKTRLVFADSLPSNFNPAKSALLSLSETNYAKLRLEPFYTQESLPADNNLNNMASQLFAKLHELDKLSLEYIVVIPCPNQGIGQAILDRLYKAKNNERSA